MRTLVEVLANLKKLVLGFPYFSDILLVWTFMCAPRPGLGGHAFLPDSKYADITVPGQVCGNTNV